MTPPDPGPGSTPPEFIPPVSSFAGPVGELIAQQMLLPPSRPGLLAELDGFEILRLLGAGGMGVVLLARDRATGNRVAVKMIRSDLVTNQNVVHRFLKEAGHLKRLQHSGVVPVLDISSRAEGPYFVMPYFDQGNLSQRIRPGQPLDNAFIRTVALQVADALAFAHRSGIIHRDLKPANLLLAAHDRACLADFGLARSLFNDSLVDVESRTLEGTAPYMSPAVAAGEAEDTRCDIYSFGAVLYEMLTGHAPYKGRGTKEILSQVIAGPPKPIKQLNPRADDGLVAIAEGCLARELRERYADMRDVLEDLRRLEQKKSPAGPRGGWFPAAARLRERTIFATILTVLILLLAGGVAWHFFGHSLARHPGPIVSKPPPDSGTNLTPNLTGHSGTPAQNTATNPVPPAAAGWTLSTLAGQAGVAGYADGTVDEAEFRLPNSVAVGPGGDLFIADTANHVIRRIAPNGVVSPLAGIPESHGGEDGAGNRARFWGPFGLAADRLGNVFVADTANDTLRKIASDGTVRTLAGVAGQPGSDDGPGPAARFRNPWAVAVDSAGNLFVADSGNHVIRQINSVGEVTTLAGTPGQPGSADGPGPAAQFNNPEGVAVDPAGNLLVADTGNHCLRKITPGGVVSTLAGLPGQPGAADGLGPAARFLNPQALTLDPKGNLYVADTGNHLIRQITPAGLVTTLAGSPGTTGSADGSAPLGRLNHPGGLAMDALGNLLIADANNHVLRRLSPPVASAP